MIGSQRRVELSLESLLTKISEYDIYRFYMPSHNWEINVNTFSPFRIEKNPSFRIYNCYGRVYHIDFSDSYFRGGCVDFVQQRYNLTYDEALRKIDVDFNLGFTFNNTSGKDYREIISKYKQPEDLGKRVTFIQVKTRKFNHTELDYWNQYHQDILDLRENNIYAIDKVYFNRRQLAIKEELVFGYFYDGYWKIYRPYAEDRKMKWFPNNVPNKTLEGTENLVISEPAFITKSKKDYMVMKKIYPYSCAVQNEGFSCFTPENVELLKSKSSKQIISFDSDVAGVKASINVTQLFGFDYCNVPRAYLREDIKDWADLAKRYGMVVIEHYLKQKFIL